MTLPNQPLPSGLTEQRAQRIRESLKALYFNWHDPAYFGSAAFETDLELHVSGRYSECVRHIVPWVNRVKPLIGRTVVEIGCGTGSSTAAFAEAVGERGTIEAYDIHGPSIDAAKARLEILGLRNTRFHLVAPAGLLGAMRERHRSGVDVFVLYAVLEHQTIVERIETLRACWEMLTPGGVLVVGDTPNRLTWMDYHTSQLPFFNSLPDELALLYAHKSPRASFVANFPARPATSAADGAELERLIRCGRGVSYHEFELALGDLRDLVVGDSFDPEILNSPHHEICLEEKTLFAFARVFAPQVPPAFLRGSLEMILQRPGENARPPLRREIPVVTV